MDRVKSNARLLKFAFVKMPHIHQDYNNCGSTACATFARFQGSTISGWDFKRLSTSPLGTGTDWGDLLNSSKYIGQQYPGGSAGHTLNVCGYLAAENLYILCNPAVATPGLQLITAADLKDFWRSDHYRAIFKGILSRPAFVLETP